MDVCVPGLGWGYTCHLWGRTKQATHRQEKGDQGRTAVSSGSGCRMETFVRDLYHSLRTPATEVITLLSQNRFWLRVTKSSRFPAKRWQINLRSRLELLIRAGSQEPQTVRVTAGLWEEVQAGPRGQPWGQRAPNFSCGAGEA